jgi:hypothetical protein
MQITGKQPRSFTSFYRIALFNLLLVAFIGSLLRFKMVASLPWVNHKYFLHGHSHFAFSGWISLVLMAAIAEKLMKAGQHGLTGFFRNILWIHLICAYGMLFSFPAMGYAPVSIFFTTCSIIVSYVFVGKIWPFCNTANWGPAGSLSVRAALAFLVLSSVGTFGLAALMATHASSQNLFFSALYFYLHFQYNGWFFFGITALFISKTPDPQNPLLYRGIKWMVMACLPAVILSGLWMKMPVWVYGLAAITAIAQLYGTVMAASGVKNNWKMMAARLSATERLLLKLSAFAFLTRILLQTLSTIPALSKFAFAYRPVVIGYLHLILLGCISIFLLAWIYGKGLWQSHKKIAATGLIFFIAGFLGTEGTLMVQGMGYIGWVSIPYMSEVLFGSALLLFSGILLLFASSRQPVSGGL